MKIKKLILLGLVFFGMTSVAACHQIKEGDTPGVEVNPDDPKQGDEKDTLFTVTFNSAGGSNVDAVTVKKNEKVGKPTDPTRADCTFEGWYYNGALFDFDTVIDKSITLVAAWKAEDKTTTYGFGEGLTAWSELEAEVGTNEVQNSDKTKTYNVLAGDVTLNDITFSSNSKNRVEADGNSYNTQGAEVTIVLKSKATVNLAGAWGSDTAGKAYIKKDSQAVYSSDSLNKNDTFSVEKELEAGTYTISSDKAIKITLLKVTRTVNYCTVTYSSEHGYNPVATLLEKNDKLSQLPALSEQGFVFEGWYTDSSFTTLFDCTKEIKEDVTLFAKWKVYNPDDYAIIHFEIAPSTQEISEITVEKNKTVSSLPVLNGVDGSRFEGWYTDDTFETKFDQTKPLTEDVTLFAKFVKQITVTYVYEDSTEIAEYKFDAGKTIPSYPSVKSIYGKVFVGWKLNGELFDKSSAQSSDITLVAAYEDVDTSASVAVLSSNGYEEGLFAEFMEYNHAESYKAYVKAENGSYQKIDDQLVRKYKDGNDTYIRVDAVGIKAGTYSLKIVPVVAGAEAEEAKAEINDLVVSAHDRSGFGFVKGSSSGAYNDDGTLKANARVIYVSNSNKDTVETKAIESKTEVTVKGLQNIITAMKAQKGISDPVCIRLLGNITDPQVLNKGDLYIDNVKNLTIEGIGTDATANGFGIVTKNSSCVEIRNIGFMNCNSSEGDDCGLQQKNDHIWVHNCDFFYGDAGSDADQAKGDGALDTKTSSYITHSYNHFYDNGKCNLQGMKSESTENYITYHHNWYDHSDSRHPRVRTCTVHIYNNYFDGNAKYGIASAIGASIFAENNYFRSTTNTIPFMSGKMAHDIKDDGSNVLSGESGGVIKEYGNVFEGDKFRYTKYQDNNKSFDAYQASSRDEIIPNTVVPASGVTYNNFDTNSAIMYQYTVETAEDAKNTVIAHAGRVQGGDFKWTFTEADDASDKVNTALKAALVAYNSKLVSVQGIDGASSTTPEPVNPTVNGVQDVIDLIQALPEASAVLEKDRAAINAAKTAYDALSASDKALVTNADKLTQCLAALPELTSFTIDFKSSSIEKGQNVTAYDANGLKVVCTKIEAVDGNGLKFGKKYGFEITNSSNTTKTLKITVIGNGDNKDFSDGTTKTTFGKKATTIEVTLAAGAKVTYTTSTGGAYLQTIVVE